MDGKVITLDNEGDSILVLGDVWTSTGPRFVVSSGLLSRASTRFKAIFEPFLKDSAKRDLISGARFEVSLNEIYRPSLEILLSILHYHQVEMHESLTPYTLSVVARLSKKYECTKALRPWATQWIRNTKEITLGVNDYGHLLMACWYFDRADLIKTVSIGVIQNLPPGFFGEWVRDTTLKQMPRALKGISMAVFPWTDN